MKYGPLPSSFFLFYVFSFIPFFSAYFFALYIRFSLAMYLFRILLAVYLLSQF